MDSIQENNLLTSSDYEHLIEDLQSDSAYHLVGHELDPLRNNNDAIIRMQGQTNPPPLQNYSHIPNCGEAIDNEMHGHGNSPDTLESYMIKDDHEMKLEHLGHVQSSMPLEASPTGTMPCRDFYPGRFNFELLLDSKSSSRRSWVYSTKLNKVFIDMNKSLLVQFRIQEYVNGLSVRALPVYSMDDYVSTPVQRCDIHILSEDVLHKAHTKDPPMCFCANYQWVRHVVRSSHSQAIYEYDCDSDRHSVRVPLELPQAGTDTVEVEYHFSCKTSCNRGMNRKPINVIYTLENELREVLGRFILPVKICSCPKRDKEKEEADAENKNGGTLNPCGPGKRRISTASDKQEGTKKIKMENNVPQENGCTNVETEQTTKILSELAAIRAQQQAILEITTKQQTAISAILEITTKQQTALLELAENQVQLRNELTNRVEPMIRAIYQLLRQAPI